MTITDVAIAARGAGFAADTLVDAIAISGAETGGTYSSDATADTRRYSAKRPAQNALGYVCVDPDTGEELPDGIVPEFSVGPWQIDLLEHADIDEDGARDYDRAAAYAFALSQGGTDFDPWSTFSTHAYVGHIVEARDAMLALPPLESPQTPQEAAGGVSDGGQALDLTLPPGTVFDASQKPRALRSFGIADKSAVLRAIDIVGGFVPVGSTVTDGKPIAVYLAYVDLPQE